jgi:pyochelin synthetase
MSTSTIDRIRRARKSLSPKSAERPKALPMPELPNAYWFGLVSGGTYSQVPVFCIERSVRSVALEGLESIWQQLVRRHEMLRAIVRPDGMFEIVEDVAGPIISISDLRHLAIEAVEHEVDQIHDAMLARVRPLDRWPLFEVRALLLPDGTTRLLFAFCVFIFDAASWFLLEREANALYRDPAADLPPPQRSYADHVAARAAEEDGPERQRALAYWADRFATFPRGPTLPAARTASPRRWTHSQFRLPPDLGAGLKATARALGLSNHSLVTAAFAETIATWSKSRHFVLTLLVQSRRPPEYAGVFGNFGSTLALEVDFRGVRSFRDRARDLHRRFLQDLEHRAVSGIQVGRELNRMSGRPPVAMFPVAFSSVWATGGARGEETSCFGSYVRRQLRVPDVSIDVGVAEHADGSIVCNLDARQDLFPEGLLVDLEAAFRELLVGLATGPQVAEQVRPIAGPKHDLALVAATNRTETAIDDRLLHELFLAEAARRPSAIAVISADRTLTYGEVEQASAALAHRLRALGVGPDALVAVPMVRGWQQAVAVLAIHRAGGAYVPIDLGLVPRERMLHMFRHAGIRVAITQPEAAAAVDWPADVTVLTVETTPASTAPPPEQAWPRQRPEDIAYVIYTSGSTGLPKGVTIDHRGAVNTVVDINRRFAIDERDRVLALSSLGFDLSVWDIFGTFAAGGVLVMPPASERPDPSAWARTAREHGVTVWNSVPKLLEITIENIGERQELWPSSLRLAMLSGDWIPTSLPGRAHALARTLQLISLGGATEASIWSIYFPIDTVDPTWPSIPYGKPLANQTFAVLDDALEQRPIWVTGELYIGGIGLAKGYWCDEDKTRASFVVHPRTGERLYRTGDLGRYLPDGNIEFLGREDSQIKVRGYRVELGEIEAVITKLPQIRETYVLAREGSAQRALERRRRAGDGTRRPGDRTGDKQLVAYLIAEPGVQIDVDSVRAAVAEKLPDYMVPAFFVVLQSSQIPRSGNGKVDRRALPPPHELHVASPAEARRMPADDLEASLLATFSKVLGVEEIGVDDSFFELGGDSVMLVRMLSLIRHAHGREISVSTFALDPRVSSIAALLRDRSGERSHERSLVVLRRDGHARPLFLVHPVGGSALAYLGLAQQLDSKRPIYALQARGLESDTTPRTTIEEMAKAYVEELRSTQPEGPYLIGGWSLGGLISFEMARQLQGQAMVLMIDSWAPNGRVVSQPIEDHVIIDWFRRDMVGIPLARGTRETVPGTISGALRRQYAVYRANVSAARSYVPQRGSVPLALIRAATVANPFATHPALRNPQLEDPALGWNKLTDRAVEVWSAEGDHYSMFALEQLTQLAALVEESLRWLEAGW